MYVLLENVLGLKLFYEQKIQITIKTKILDAVGIVAKTNVLAIARLKNRAADLVMYGFRE